MAKPTAFEVHYFCGIIMYLRSGAFAMPTGKKAVTVYFDDQLYERVTAAAKADRRSVANFIEAAVDVVAPHQLGTRVMLASRIAPTPVFEKFHPSDERTDGEIFVWATI